MNFGLCELRLVAPDCGDEWCTEEALSRACGAVPVLDNTVKFDELSDACADVGLVLATTARPRDCALPVYNPREAAELAARTISTGSRVAFLFGSEKNGLSAEELRVAHAIVTVPTEKLFFSLNLAQAVLLIAYEWSAAQSSTRPQERTGDKQRDSQEMAATGKQLEALFSFWEHALWQTRFFRTGGNAEERSGRPAAAMAKLRALLMRAQPSSGEVGLLHGSLIALFKPKAPARENRQPESIKEGGDTTM
eukprot:6187880-Pleurochrysis_carterae.AAC.4